MMNKTIVFYDGSCSMCVGVTGWLSKIDHKNQFLLEPYQYSQLLKNYPQINPVNCEKEIHIITDKGKVLRGADAMMEIWRKTDHWSNFLGSVFRLPPFIWIARLLYRLVARYRKSIYE